MPETRYIYEYLNGVLVNTIPFVVSDERLADERADAMMAELKQTFKDGAYPISSKPATGEKRVKSVHTDTAGNIKTTRET